MDNFIFRRLDIQGVRCPESIMMVRKIIREIPINKNVLIISDDPVIDRDISFFCHFMGHKLIKIFIKKIPYRYIIHKKIE